MFGWAVLGIALQSVRLARLRLLLDRQNTALSSALEQISRLATRDDLTGLLNRRHRSELLVNEKARHDRSGLPKVRQAFTGPTRPGRSR